MMLSLPNRRFLLTPVEIPTGLNWQFTNYQLELMELIGVNGYLLKPVDTCHQLPFVHV